MEKSAKLIMSRVIAALSLIASLSLVAEDEPSYPLETKQLQAQIDALAAKGGGTLTITKGVHCAGALFFRPGVNLHLEDGAVLLGTDDRSEYPIVKTRMTGLTLDYYPALVNADKCDGFKITGKGIIDGHGYPTWKPFWEMRANGTLDHDVTFMLLRPRLVYVSNSRNVDISGVTFRDSKFWTLHFYRCTDLNIHDCEIIARKIKGVLGPSTDAIDLDVVTNAVIRNVYMDVNDDAVCMKGGKGPWADDPEKRPDAGPNYNILVENCTFGPMCHSCFTCGSEAVKVDGVVMRNCKANGAIQLLNLKMRPDTPQTYRNIVVSNCTGTVRTGVNVFKWTQWFDTKGRKDIPTSIVRNVRVDCPGLKANTPFSISKNGGFTVDDVSWNIGGKTFRKGGAVNPCDLKFAKLASRRFMFDNELTLCEYRPETAVADTVQYPVLTNGLRVVGGYWPAAHYRARVTALPAEIAFATADGDVKLRFPVEGDIPKPPFDFSVCLTCSHMPSVFVEKDGKTRLLRTDPLPKDFNPRLKSHLVDLKFCVRGNVSEASASLSAGIGQADVRFVTTGRENKLYMEDGRVFFTFSSRAYGTYQGVASFNPSLFDVRLEGVILFDYGDGQLRNDISSHIFYDGDAGEWRGYSSNFSTGSDSLNKRAAGGLNAIWSKKNPLHGLSVMHSKSLGLTGMNEDPCGTYDAEAGKWRLFVSEFRKGIKASMLESSNWDGPFTHIAGPVDRDSTGTTVTWIGGSRYCFSGSSDQACYVYSYPDLELVGKLKLDFPPWNDDCRNGRVWPCVAELPEGYPFRYIMLTMDRANFPGMPKRNWTYGGLHLYGALP